MGQFVKKRFGKDASQAQIIAGMGFLLCALGTPCIYYGTEQGFGGAGEGDFNVRVAMFTLENQQLNTLNKSCVIYQQVAMFAQIRKTCLFFPGYFMTKNL